MRQLMFIWLALSVFLGFEYWALETHPKWSLLTVLVRPARRLTTEPGGTVSLWMGWLGFGLMVIMNGYSIRKRFGSLAAYGRLSSWLNFHIFCGLVGPTFILFHCHLKARGIVAISFWSMIVSFTSGIIGRYFFAQIAIAKRESENEAIAWVGKFDQILTSKKIQIEPPQKELLLRQALDFVGAGRAGEAINPFVALVRSLAGDFRTLVSDPPVPMGWSRRTQICLVQYGLASRRAQFLLAFQRLMGYWHAFHFPFAIFMYLAAVIHIISSLIFWRAG